MTEIHPIHEGLEAKWRTVAEALFERTTHAASLLDKARDSLAFEEREELLTFVTRWRDNELVKNNIPSEWYYGSYLSSKSVD